MSLRDEGFLYVDFKVLLFVGSGPLDIDNISLGLPESWICVEPSANLIFTLETN